MNYTSQYAELVQKHLDRVPKPSDGLSDAEIREAEERLGLRLPTSVRSYYKVAGNLADLNKMHNRLFEPSELLVENEFIIFMEENQAVVHWGIRTSELSDVDPEVWQRVNSTPSAWYSEGMSFSEFIVRMFDWQAGFEQLDST